MKRLADVAPEVLTGLRQRAIRDLAMGRITQRDCDIVVGKLDDTIGFIHNMEEREEDE
jgi:hypothetical protein